MGLDYRYIKSWVLIMGNTDRWVKEIVRLKSKYAFILVIIKRKVWLNRTKYIKTVEYKINKEQVKICQLSNHTIQILLS